MICERKRWCMPGTGSAPPFRRGTWFRQRSALSDKPMKKATLLAMGSVVLAVWIGTAFFAKGQDKRLALGQEVAVIKWDGNDKVCVNLPNKSEILHVFELSSTRTPKEMQDEEFCLAWTANKLAKEGWEVVALDSRRLVFRRSVGLTH